MTELKWTTERPTKHGWYWIKFREIGTTFTIVAHLSHKGFYWSNEYFSREDEDIFLFAGPIPEPSE